MLINWEESAELNNMSVDQLKRQFEKFPQSNRKISVECKNCHIDRIVMYCAYRDLCANCGNKKRWGSLLEREKQSIRMSKRFEDPDERRKIAESVKKSYEKDPTMRERQAKATKRRYEDPKERDKVSKKSREVHNDNPILAQSHSEYMKKRWRDPIFKQKHSNCMIKQHQNRRWNNQIDNFISGDPIMDWIPPLTRDYGISQEGYDIWRHAVYERDDHTCQICGLNHYEIQAHHIIPQRINQNLILNVDNGITMCRNCHESIKGKEEIFIDELQMIVDKII